MRPDPTTTLPDDVLDATLVGRIWIPEVAGPSPVVVRDGAVWDISDIVPTVRDLCEQKDPTAVVLSARGRRIAGLGELLTNTDPGRRDRTKPWLLAPIDLQTLKGAGVTFAVSLMERVIEERARGDVAAAALTRSHILDEIGTDLPDIVPGSPQAAALKTVLLEDGMWSQYLEVGIGPDAEIFTKAPTLSAVGTGVPVGVRAASTWNNPEPEVGLVVNSRGRAVGATLGNDVNLRDFEGRSALLLPQAKDNNASCALGPFLRLFDDHFDLDVVRAMRVRLNIEGEDGFVLNATSDMRQISRDPLSLVDQLCGPHHQYPDGAVLLLGTMFAPVEDRDEPGRGFTHKRGDVVAISAGPLGALVNSVEASEDCEPWTFGLADLMRNLAGRGLLQHPFASDA